MLRFFIITPKAPGLPVSRRSVTRWMSSLRRTVIAWSLVAGGYSP